jgi:hypothetical protein
MEMLIALYTSGLTARVKNQIIEGGGIMPITGVMQYLVLGCKGMLGAVRLIGEGESTVLSAG